MLKKTDANPMEPQSDDEKLAEKKAEEKKDDAKAKPDDKSKADAKDKGKEKDKDKDGDKDKKEEAVTVTIDFENIGQRIVALPIKGANYIQLDSGKAGTLYLSEIPDVPSLSGPYRMEVPIVFAINVLQPLPAAPKYTL